MMDAVSSTRYRVIVFDPSRQAILARRSDSGWRLPGWATSATPNWEDASAVNAGVMQSLGLRVAMLRAVALDWSGAGRDSYYVAESLDPAWQPPSGMAWIDCPDAARLSWGDPNEGQRVAALLAECPSPARVPWYRPGWFATAASWIAVTLREVGIDQTGEVEQLRAWERCSLFRAPTAAGDVFFKAVPRQWGHEPALTACLSRAFPELSPEVLAHDAERGYLLMADFGGSPLTDIDGLDAWQSTYAALARIQRELAGRSAELRAVGVPLHGPEQIAPRIGVMLRDERRLRLGMEQGLGREQVELLRAHEDRIVDACIRLASGPIPLSLDHGDFWLGNMRMTQRGPLLFDWSDAALTHPFFSLVMAADEIGASLAVAGAPQAVIDAYLTEWTDFVPLPELRAVFDDAMLVGPLHQALMYRDVYLPAMEFVDELDRMTPHFLRWLANRLE